MFASQALTAAMILAGSAHALNSTLMVHVVSASDSTGALTFSPNAITAAVGDMVQFQFYPGNHSVVMGSFAKPCQPISNTDPLSARNAFFSGFMPVASAADGGTLTYTIRIQDTKPVWYYCSQGRHCQDGMVGVINPPQNSQQSITTFAAAAKAAPANVTSGSTPSGLGGSTPGSGTPGSGTPGSGTSGSGTSGSGTSGSSMSGSSGTPAATRKNGATSNFIDAAKRGFLGMCVTGVIAFIAL